MGQSYKRIRINDQFEFSPSTRGWELHEHHKINASNKSKNRNKRPSTTYHATLKQLCAFVIDRYARNAGSLPEILKLLTTASTELTENLEAICNGD